jgi:hypothetical protein
MSVYTDMEESIMDCWMVVDDLRAMAESEEAIPASLLMSFAQVYAFKFSRLAGLHEDALKEYYTLKEDSTEEVDPFSVEEIGEMQW